MTSTIPWNTSRGYSDADWASDPVTRKSTSCTLCYVINSSSRVHVEDRVLSPSPVEKHTCLLLVHCQLSWFSHKLSSKRYDYHSWYTREHTAAQHAQWRRNKEQVEWWITFRHYSYSFQIWCFWKLLRVWVKTVNPSGIGTKALGRERFHRLGSMLGMGTALIDELTWQMVQWRRVAMKVTGYGYGGFVESKDRHTWATVDFGRFFSAQRGTLRESDTALRREEVCLLNPRNVVWQKVTSQPVTVDTTVTFFSY